MASSNLGSNTQRILDPIDYALHSPSMKPVMFEVTEHKVHKMRTYGYNDNIWSISDPLTNEFRVLRPSELVCYNRYNDQLLRMIPNESYVKTREPVVMFVNGACQEYRTAKDMYSPVVAGYGVFLANDSPFTCAGRVPKEANQTIEAAEIFAALEAVEMAKGNLVPRKLCKTGVVIITDSSYLFEAVTKYTYSWLSNGLKNLEAHLATNRAAIMELHRTIEELEDCGISVCFWKVLREDNLESHRLARVALGTCPLP
ncbi:unnamed protein product [Calypogeia fissa]